MKYLNTPVGLAILPALYFFYSVGNCLNLGQLGEASLQLCVKHPKFGPNIKFLGALLIILATIFSLPLNLLFSFGFGIYRSFTWKLQNPLNQASLDSLLIRNKIQTQINYLDNLNLGPLPKSKRPFDISSIALIRALVGGLVSVIWCTFPIVLLFVFHLPKIAWFISWNNSWNNKLEIVQSLCCFFFLFPFCWLLIPAVLLGTVGYLLLSGLVNSYSNGIKFAVNQAMDQVDKVNNILWELGSN